MKITCDRIRAWARKWIRRMLEFYKKCWQVFLPLSAGFGLGILQAIYYLNEDSHQRAAIIILSVLAVICLIIGLIGFINAFKQARKEKKEAKVAKNHEALRDSFKTLYIKEGKSPEEAQKLAEIAAADMPLAPPIEGEEEWVSPRGACEKSRRKHR